MNDNRLAELERLCDLYDEDDHDALLDAGFNDETELLATVMCDVPQLIAEVRRLRADNQQLLAMKLPGTTSCKYDAERYRWLRDNYLRHGDFPRPILRRHAGGKEFDADVDAAMTGDSDD